jgi:cytochrome bd-type quinol oxidase subunit 1
VTKLDLARLQFAMTSIYHFLFVPITIGLGFLVAMLQTSWYRRGNEAHLRLTRFFGTLLVINIAVGVVTGLVQEFQFGMDWSAYSRYVGDVFGAPLAIEGLAAFFLESTFLGLWLFGWGRLSKRVHLATIWVVAIGAAASAAFIMAANSWMQNPVGYVEKAGRAELTNIWAVLTNPVFLWGYLHVLLASLVTGSVLMLGVSAWHLRRDSQVDVFRRTAALSLAVLVPTSIFAIMVGSHLGVVETTYQPMKIAAVEAQWETCQPCSFSLFQIGGYTSSNESPTEIIAVPHLLSLLATDSWNGKVVGLNELNQQYQQQYGPGDYVPNVFIAYWSMRAMAYLGTLVVLIALWGAWLLHRRRLDTSRLFLRVAAWAVVIPVLINTAGWVLTENGRQPWIVQGLMKTSEGVSPSVGAGTIWFSLITFTILYGALAVAAWVLMTRYARKEVDPLPEFNDRGAPETAMSY